MPYIPTPGPLPGQQWDPADTRIIDGWCCRCARDKALREGAPLEECDDNECCPIVGAAFMGGVPEWREMPDGEVKCIAYIPAGGDIPDPRCEHTAELFGGDE